MLGITSILIITIFLSVNHQPCHIFPYETDPYTPFVLGIQGPSTPTPTRMKTTCICNSSGRAVEQTATRRRGSAIAHYAQGAPGQLLVDHFPGLHLNPCQIIY